MKKILHISKYYYPFRGGTEQIAQDIVKSLNGKYEQRVICFNHEHGSCNDFVDGVEVIRCGCIGKIASQSLSLSYGRSLKNAIMDFRPDVIIFHYPNPFVATFLLHYLPSDTKFVVYWHLDIVKQKIIGKFFVGQNWELIKRASVLIATSPLYIDGSYYLKSAKEKCKVVPNCINEKRFTETKESQELCDHI